MLIGSFEELHAAGCIQTGADVTGDINLARERFERLFRVLQVATAGDCCEGCPAYNRGRCKAFRQYNTRARGEKPGETHTPASGGASVRRRCPECRCKIRGANHDSGQHHKNRVKARK